MQFRLKDWNLLANVNNELSGNCLVWILKCSQWRDTDWVEHIRRTQTAYNYELTLSVQSELVWALSSLNVGSSKEKLSFQPHDDDYSYVLSSAGKGRKSRSYPWACHLPCYIRLCYVYVCSNVQYVASYVNPHLTQVSWLGLNNSRRAASSKKAANE